jgi:hypothetical protein
MIALLNFIRVHLYSSVSHPNYSAFRPALRGVQGSPEPRRIQDPALNLTWFRAHFPFFNPQSAMDCSLDVPDFLGYIQNILRN